MNFKKTLIVYLLIAGLILTPVAFSFGQLSVSNESSSQLALNPKEEKVKNSETIIDQIQKALEKLFSAGDENRLSNDEKNLQEIETGKQVLKEIINLSIEENQGFLEKIEKFIILEEYQKIIKEDIQQADFWYSEINKKIDDLKNQEEIRSLAKDIKDWRQNSYEGIVQRAISTILVSQEDRMIELAEKRLEKIKADLKKLAGLGFDTSQLTELLERANEDIASGSLINKEAESKLEILFSENSSTLNEASSSINEESSATSSESETASSETASSTPLEKLSTSSINSAATAETSTEQNEENKLSIKDLVIKSNDKIKSAYVFFLRMADLIRSGSL